MNSQEVSKRKPQEGSLAEDQRATCPGGGRGCTRKKKIEGLSEGLSVGEIGLRGFTEFWEGVEAQRFKAELRQKE